MSVDSKLARLTAIDELLRDAGGYCGVDAADAAEGEEGGVILIGLGTLAEAERLNDLLYDTEPLPATGAEAIEVVKEAGE